ncbi:MAG TPA: diacylglycerol kinase family protein [Actinoplanes sp.]
MPNDEIAVLANPTAGRGRHRVLLPGVLQRLGAAGHTVRLLTAGTGAQAEQACRRAVADGVAALVAVGGDGTVHRALQAVAGTGVGFGVVPAGTGNDFAAGTAAARERPEGVPDGRERPEGVPDGRERSEGVPEGSLHAAEAIAGALRDQRDHRVDLGLVRLADGSRRWFGTVLAAGFDAVVNERANRMRWPRGRRRYDLAILLELARLRSREYTLGLDGAEHRFAGPLVAVGNCPSYGGGLRILPDADPADGLLDVVIAAPLSRVALARLKPLLRLGTHIRDPRVTTFRAKSVQLDAAGIIGYADGERIGPLPLEITCEPGAVRLLR